MLDTLKAGLLGAFENMIVFLGNALLLCLPAIIVYTPFAGAVVLTIMLTGVIADRMGPGLHDMETATLFIAGAGLVAAAALMLFDARLANSGAFLGGLLTLEGSAWDFEALRMFPERMNPLYHRISFSFFHQHPMLTWGLMMAFLGLLAGAITNAWQSLGLLPVWIAIHFYLLNAVAWSIHGVYVIIKTALTGTNIFALVLIVACIGVFVLRQPADTYRFERRWGKGYTVRRRG